MHQLLVYFDDVNLLVENIIPQKNVEALLNTIKEVGLEVNSQKFKYMFMSFKQNSGS
jgi:hypothetical protein